MPKFQFVAMDAKGAERQGVVDADSQSQAISAIRAKGLFPTKVTEAGKKSAQRREPGGQTQSGRAGRKGTQVHVRLPRFMRRRVKPKQLMVYTRQLATLVDAGLPLLRGITVLLKQERHPALREALVGMADSVEGGSTFSEALAGYPRIFDRLYVNMVRAGEAGGVLELVLTRLAEFMEKRERVKSRVRSAMVYPVVVLIVAILILSFLLIKIIPKFASIFEELLGGKGLPPLTQFVINVSNFMVHEWYIILGSIVLIVILSKVWRRTATGAYTLDRVKLRLPVFGVLYSKTAIARFSRTLGTLMTSGVPILQALNIVRDTAGNEVVSRAIQHVHDSVKEGDAMATPMSATAVFPGMVVSMVDVGEETGALPEMLLRVADNYDEEVDRAVEALTSIIEPVMIIMLAVIVGTIVIAMFVPLISIIGELSM